MLGNSLLNKNDVEHYYWLHRKSYSMQYCSQQHQLETINVGKAQEMYSSVLNSLTGVVPLGGHNTVGVAAHWRNCRLCTDCLIVSCSVIH